MYGGEMILNLFEELFSVFSFSKSESSFGFPNLIFSSKKIGRTMILLHSDIKIRPTPKI